MAMLLSFTASHANLPRRADEPRRRARGKNGPTRSARKARKAQESGREGKAARRTRTHEHDGALVVFDSVLGSAAHDEEAGQERALLTIGEG